VVFCSRNLSSQILMSDRVEIVRSTIDVHYDNETYQALSSTILSTRRLAATSEALLRRSR
jgi:hypothetical protein